MSPTGVSHERGVEMKSGSVGRRLIEEWMPIAELGIESLRERTPMTPFPAPNRLHVWWARRPLVASRAAILGALLPAGADKKKYLHLLGIHGDPLAARKRIAKATEDGVRLGKDAYGYPRAFGYTPKAVDLDQSGMRGSSCGAASLLDPTAGGGSIPFEGLRLGLATFANDLNPVAWLILRTTVEFPALFGKRLLERFAEIGGEFVRRMQQSMGRFYPDEPRGNCIPDGYLWARTVRCPYCDGVVPLSPNWRLDGGGTGVRLIPDTRNPHNRHIRFEIVKTLKEQSPGTVSGGDGLCPLPDCGRPIDGDEIKKQAQEGKMGEQLYAIVYKEQKVVGHTKAGKPKIKNERGYRAPRPEDDVREQVRAALDAKLPEWQARGIIPDEEFPENSNDDRPRQYGMPLWRDLFAPRQLYGHCVGVEVFHDLIHELGGPDKLSDLDRAAFVYLALAMDKFISYNNRRSRWHPGREVMAQIFERHDFSIAWSSAEMAPTIAGLGYDWAIEQTAKALEELIELVGGPTGDHQPPAPGQKRLIHQPSLTFHDAPARPAPRITITCDSGDRLTHLADASIDAIVMDPPYYANVMYAELADFFYVWLKRTAGLLFPEPFAGYLTDKDREAVANPARFKEFKQVRGSGGADKRARRDYQERMQAIFAECRRVLKPDGIMVLMFTHKATGAWDALAKGLIEAGFIITASWPINTEAEGSLHIKDKNAAKSTIFLVCRPRLHDPHQSTTYWEEVEPEVARVVQERVQSFQDNGIRGVDLYLASFGPALEVFSRHWPMQRGRAIQKPPPVKGAQLQLEEEEEFDPYAVRPEDALLAARREVKQWRLARLVEVQRKAHLDPVTEFYVLAWDAFGSVQFPADEALKLARVVGVNFDAALRNHVLMVKTDDVILFDSTTRAQKGNLPKTGETLLDDLHITAHLVRTATLEAAKAYLDRAGRLHDPNFHLALDTILHVLPAPRLAAGSKSSPITLAAADAEALDKIRQYCFAKDVQPPRQWTMEFE